MSDDDNSLSCDQTRRLIFTSRFEARTLIVRSRTYGYVETKALRSLVLGIRLQIGDITRSIFTNTNRKHYLVFAEPELKSCMYDLATLPKAIMNLYYNCSLTICT